VAVRVALIAGSGLHAVTERISGTTRPWVPSAHADLPPAPGHRMEVTEGSFGGLPALGFGGRLHYYQGYSMAEVTQNVTEAHHWGAEVLFVTNASGSLRAEVATGEIALVRDHLNLMPDNPLRGSALFLDLSDAYDEELRRMALVVASARRIRLPEVVYVGVAGPTFETPAEVGMLRMLGGDVAGMSTIPEVIMARHLGMRVLAVSVVTNRAGAASTAHEVLHVAKARAGSVADLLEGVALALA